MEEKKPIYLIFVDPQFGDMGHNKEYNMTPLGDGTFKVLRARAVVWACPVPACRS